LAKVASPILAANGNGRSRAPRLIFGFSKDAPIAKLLADVSEDRLEPIVVTDVVRTTQSLEVDGDVVEAALDLGSIVAGEAKQDIRELELELRQGTPGSLYQLALELNSAVPFDIEVESKAARGFRLKEGLPPQATKPAAIRLKSDDPAIEALRAIIGEVLHAHTDRSDGLDTLEAMAEATLSRGYEYFGVTDHSRSAHYAGGLSPEEVAEQQAEADRLNKKYGKRFRIFKGVESDILVDGSLDYPEEVLETFDFVVASVHGRFKMDRAAQTERIIRAVSNPYTTILGHMTGRQLLRRPGYDIDIEKVLSACAEHGVAVEINSNPWRLDLDWRWHESALSLGCLMSINPDAHSTRELDLTHWGVEMARKGGVPKDRVLNCHSKDELASYLEKRAAERRIKSVPFHRGSAGPRTSAAAQKSGPHRVRTEKWLSANVSGPPSDGRN
jgi:histidinol phosphatase-like PHP family hydrolase